MTAETKEGLYKVVKTVASPLRFFAVAAIALAGIVIILSWKSTLPPETTSFLICAAFVVLIFLIAIVSFLVIFYPKKLIFDQEAHLTVLRERLGDSELKSLYFPGALPSIEPPKTVKE